MCLLILGVRNSLNEPPSANVRCVGRFGNAARLAKARQQNTARSRLSMARIIDSELDVLMLKLFRGKTVKREPKTEVSPW
jgi:hypothetical protein